LQILASSYGSFTDTTTYLYFFLTAWLYSMSCLFGQWWYNPFQFEFKYIRIDFRDWLRWMHTGKGGPDLCWEAWFRQTQTNQYADANLLPRAIRLIRVCRLLIPAFILAIRNNMSHQPAIAFLGHIIIAAGLVLVFEVEYRLTSCFGPTPEPAAGGGHGHGHGAPAAAAPSGPRPSLRRLLLLGANPVFRLLRIVTLLGVLAAAIYLGNISLSTNCVSCGVDAFLAFCFVLWWFTRVLIIISCWPLANGCRAACKIFDFLIGLFLISVQAVCAICMPFARVVSMRC
jgi:hypothetical protein